MITAYADVEATIAALRAGAADFVLKPFRLKQILTAVERCFERRWLARENTALRRQVNDFVDRLYGTAGMIGRSQPMRDVSEMIKRVAPTPTSVLIEGETGTGKELAARAIHRFSGQRGAFVPVNCVAISPDLIQSELFGHTKGPSLAPIRRAKACSALLRRYFVPGRDLGNVNQPAGQAPAGSRKP